MEKELRFNNFYKHPRFWRHVTAWFIFISLLSLTLVSTYMNQSKEEQKMERSLDEQLSEAVVTAITDVYDDNAEKENPKRAFWKDFPDIFGSLMEILILIYGSFYAYNKLFKQRKYLLLLAIIVGLVLLSATLGSIFNTSVTQIGAIKGFWADLVIFPFILLVAFGFKLAYHGGRQLFVIQRLEAKQTESELKLLKSQVNPHFLFNTLNNIYAANLEDHDNANDIILELADLLRYQLESGKKQFTSLQDEISSLENYISLEKIRVRDCEVNVFKHGNFDSVAIVPLLLLPFVENAFKYGTGIQAGKIDLRFELDEKGLFSFYCKNKIVQKKGKVHSGGIGLDNVKKRLDLMYRNKYELEIKETEMDYEVDLKMRLNV